MTNRRRLARNGPTAPNNTHIVAKSVTNNHKKGTIINGSGSCVGLVLIKNTMPARYSTTKPKSLCGM